MKKITLFILLLSGLTLQAQNIGINGTGVGPDPSAMLDIIAADKGLLIPRVSIVDALASAPITAPVTSLLVYNTNAAITNGNGEGYYYWDGSQWVKFFTGNPLVDNGLYYNVGADRVRLGGPLVESTTITQGANWMVFDLDGTGGFSVQDNGVNSFLVLDDGRVKINTTTDATAANNTGSLEIANSLRIDGNEIITNTNAALYMQNDNNGDFRVDATTFAVDASTDRVGIGTISPLTTLDVRGGLLVNENGDDVDVRMESVNRVNALRIDAGNDVVRFGFGTGALTGNGTAVGGVTVDYVADFDIGLATGTAIGIGSIEYILDGNSETTINNTFSPTQHLIYDLGFNGGTARFWDDVYADAFVTASDMRLKHNVKELKYGLKEIMELEAISYVLNDDPFQENKLGLSAQQTLKIVPEAVKTHNYIAMDESNPEDYTKVELDRMGMSYQTLIPVLIKAIQEQQAQIEDLKKIIEKK